MRITIEKVEGDRIKVTLVPSTGSKPLTLELRRDQMNSIIDVAKSAMQAKTFAFTYEVE